MASSMDKLSDASTHFEKAEQCNITAAQRLLLVQSNFESLASSITSLAEVVKEGQEELEAGKQDLDACRKANGEVISMVTNKVSSLTCLQ